MKPAGRGWLGTREAKRKKGKNNKKKSKEKLLGWVIPSEVDITLGGQVNTWKLDLNPSNGKCLAYNLQTSHPCT